MLNNNIFADTLHRMECFLASLAHQVHFAEGAVSNDAYELEVFEGRIDQGVFAPEGLWVGGSFVVGVELRVKVMVQTH